MINIIEPLFCVSFSFLGKVISLVLNLDEKSPFANTAGKLESK